MCLALGPRADRETARLASLAAYEAEATALHCSVNWPFGGSERTLTAFVRERSGSALQLEIAVRLQQPVDNRLGPLRILEWLARVDGHVNALFG